MARRRKLKKVSLAQPEIKGTFDLRSNTILNLKADVIGFEIDSVETPGTKDIIWRNRNDHLYLTYHQKAIDGPQLRAGERWRECYEICISGGIRGQRMREYVDISQGFNYEMPSQEKIECGKDLKKASSALGVIGERVLKLILIDGMFPRDVAEYMGHPTDRRTRYYSDMFKDCLDTLARVWGTDPKAKLNIEDMFPLCS